MADTGQNIDLGTFSWDISKLEQEIIKNRQEMENFSAVLNVNKKALKDDQKAMLELAGQIKIMQGVQKTAKDMLDAGTLSQQEYTETMALSNKGIAENEAAIKATAQAQSAHIKTILEQEAAVKELKKANYDLNKLMETGRQDIDGNEQAYRELNKELNAAKLIAKNLGAEVVNMERAGNGAGQAYEDLKKEWISASKYANELNEDFKKLDKAVGDNQRTVGDYKDQIVGAFSEIGTGFSQIKNGDISGGFETLRSGFKGVTEDIGGMSKALLANPLVIIGAVLTGLALAFNEVSKYNEQLYEANKITQGITKLQGDLLDKVTIRTQTLEEILGLDRESTLESARALVTQFGISYAEALDLIEDGAIRGGAANGEYLDSLKEYPTFFAQAGFSAKEFIDIINAGADLGVFKDKLPDAIKEFGLSITEQTKPARDALVNAFGAAFSDDLLKKVERGQLTVKDALIDITKESEKYNLTAQQQAQLTADLFKGAGEDVGGFAKVVDIVTVALIDQGGALTETQQLVKNQIDSYNDLGEAKNDALKSDAILALKREFEIFWNDLKIGFYRGITYIKSFDLEFRASSRYMSGVFASLPKAAASSFEGILAALSGLLKGFGSGASSIALFFKGDFEGAKAEADKFAGALPAAFAKIKASYAKMGSDISKGAADEAQKFRDSEAKKEAAYASAQRVIEAKRAAAAKTGGVGGAVDQAAAAQQKAADAEAKKAAALRTKNDKEKEAANKKALKDQEDAAKKALDILKAEADQKTAIAKNELADYIAINAAKLDDDKRLSADKIELQKKYLEDLLALQLSANTAEMEKALVGKTEEEKIEIKKEFAIKATELSTASAIKEAEITKKYNDQTAEDKKLADAISYQSKLIELEEQGASEYEIRTAMLEEQKAADLERLEEDRANALLSQENYEAQKALIEQAAAAESKQITKDVDDYKIQSRAQVLGGLADLFGKESALGKVFAAAEIANNTVQQSSKAFAQAALFAANPLTAALAPNAYIQGGIIIASGAAQLAKLVAPKKGFSGGGYTGAGGVNEEAGIVHRGEVVWSQRDVAAVGGARVADAMRPSFAGYAMGGIVGSSMPGVQRSVSAKNSPLMIDKNALSLIADAIYAGSQEGIGAMADNRSIRQAANF